MLNVARERKNIAKTTNQLILLIFLYECNLAKLFVKKVFVLNKWKLNIATRDWRIER